MIEFIKHTATGKIAALIVLGFLIEMFLYLYDPNLGKWFISTFGLNSNINLLTPLQLITCMFLHGGIYHLLFNLITLLSFGPIVEAMIGEREFLKLYFGSGILGGILFIVCNNIFGTTSIAIGASGAIAGLLGFLSVVRPNMPVIFFIIPMNILLATVIFIIFSLMFIVSGHPGAFNIAHAAHLGGVLFGIYYGFEKIRERIEHF